MDEPVWIWLLAPGVAITLLGARWLIAVSPARRRVAVSLRLGLLACLATALAGLASVQQVDVLGVVAVVDTSASVQRYYRDSRGGPGLDQVRQFLERAAERRGPDDLLGVVLFDGEAASAMRPRRGPLGELRLDTRMGDGTNIAQALELARAMIPPDASPRIVLFSDGVETVGDSAALAAESGATRKGPVDVVPLVYNLAEEVVVEALDAPATAPADATVSLRAAISATAPSRGFVRLLREGDPVDLTPQADGDSLGVSLVPGMNIVRLEVPLRGSRVHRFRLVYEPDTLERPDGSVYASGDTIPDNNHAEAFTVTPGRGAVLLVDGLRGGEGGTLTRTLREVGSDVQVVGPLGIPADLLALQAFDLVILENVPADVPEASQRALAAYVSDMGGGLVMVGGPDAYAAGGWRGSTLEPLLPVLLETPDLLLTPQAATVFVLDNSGSMSWPVLGTGRSQQEIANDAAALALRSLDRRDLVGIITFNSRASILVPLAPHANPAATTAQVRDIGSGGGTNLVPGLELAHEEMTRAGKDAKVKHVVVLSDGASRGKERLSERVAAMAADGITVSTVAVGDGADQATLRALSEQGGGSYFHAVNATQLPRLLLKAVRVVRTPFIREEPFTPVLLPTGSPLTVGQQTLLPLGGLALTRPRPDPGVTLAMVTPSGEPVLASWNVGLGQVAAWTSDAETWATPWMATPAYAKLWTQVLRTISRPPESASLRAESELRDGAMWIRLSASGEDGSTLDGLSVSAAVYAPSGRASEVALRQVAPGLYEGTAGAGETGPYIAVVKPSRNGRALPAAITGSSILEGAEFRARSSDLELLAALARNSEGRVLDIDDPDASDLWNRAGAPPREAVTTLWRSLLVLALVLLVLDIGVRRVAWDRWFSRRFNPEMSVLGTISRVELSSLRHTIQGPDAGEPVIALGDAEAERLTQAARDRRREQRLAAYASGSAEGNGPPPPPPPEAAAEPEQGKGLLAAKRRARDRFEKDN